VDACYCRLVGTYLFKGNQFYFVSHSQINLIILLDDYHEK